MQIDRSRRSPNFSSRMDLDISMLVVHATAGSLRSSLTWLTDEDSKVSCHYLIAKSGKIYQLVPDEFAAWHAGRGYWRGEHRINECSIGIELENLNNGTDPYPKAQLDALLWLSRDLVSRYGIPQGNLVTHKQVAIPAGRKSDPAGFPRWAEWYLPSVYGKPTEWRWYRVKWWATAGYIVRPQPQRVGKLAVLRPWATFLGRTIRGELYSGTDVWVQRHEGGFVHFGGVEATS